MYKYLKLEDYETFKYSAIKHRETFTLITTSTTKRIEYEDLKLVFNSTGERLNPKVINLINKVRRDADLYTVASLLNKKNNISSEKIEWLKANDCHSQGEYDIIKLDITAAYWTLALQVGLISKQTYEYWENLDLPPKKQKMARLQALGSLASVKTVTKYVDGKAIGDPELIFNKLRRNSYLYICYLVDQIMNDIRIEFEKEILGYYWDCFFIKSENNTDEIMQRLEFRGLSAKEQMTRVILLKDDTGTVIIDKKTGVIYNF